MSHNLDEALIGLYDALAAESDLTDLLGGADQIYREPPTVKVTYPILIVIVPEDNPQIQFSGTGIWRPDLEIGIHAKKQSTCRAILGVLDEHFDIPRNRTAAIDSANFSISLMRRTNAVAMGPISLVDTDEPIHLINSLWQLRVHKTS